MPPQIDALSRRREERDDSQLGSSQSFSAPTPYNTYLSPSVHDQYETLPPSTPTRTNTGTTTSGSVTFEAYQHPGDVSFGPSISSPSHDRTSIYSESHASANLISPTRSFDPTISVLPQSNLPTPAPPSRLSSAGTKSSLFPPSDPGLAASSASSSSSGSKPKWTWRGRRKAKEELTQDDRDAQRLKQLGYDAVLGREYNFWSSLAITTLNIGALQVCSITLARISQLIKSGDSACRKKHL
jgi:hypothetical protein